MLVARPAILYLQGVPVLWLPFIFQDIRSGRRSGILTPRFGFAELVRNSPTVPAHDRGRGVLFRAQRLRGPRRLPGLAVFGARHHGRSRMAAAQLAAPLPVARPVHQRGFAVSRHTLSTGTSNLQLSWNHSQDFSSTSRITSNLNYVTSTTVQRQTALNPMTALATIASQLNYSRSMGPFALSVGGSRRQYPGRAQVDQDFPSINLSSKAIQIGRFVDWTPTFNIATSSSAHLDAQGDFKYRYFERNGVLDSARFDRATTSTTGSLNSPFKIGSFNLPLSFNFSDRMNDFPEVRVLVPVNDTSQRETRVYSRTYMTTLDWRTAVALPTFLHGSWNLSPSVSIENVDPAGFWVRSERTGSNFVSQSSALPGAPAWRRPSLRCRTGGWSRGALPPFHHAHPVVVVFAEIERERRVPGGARQDTRRLQRRRSPEPPHPRHHAELRGQAAQERCGHVVERLKARR